MANLKYSGKPVTFLEDLNIYFFCFVHMKYDELPAIVISCWRLSQVDKGCHSLERLDRYFLYRELAFFLD